MTSFAALKNSSGNLERLTKEIEKLNAPQGKSNEDERFWKPTRDKAGNGFAIVRFLPTPGQDGDDGMPWVHYWDHGFQGPTGKWYIEKSLTSLGKHVKDPVSEFNSKLWKASDNDDGPERKQARKQKRRLSYISNILVIKDPGNPENEGKVFLYKYGKKIFEKLHKAMHPQFDSEGRSVEHPKYNPTNAYNPFDFWKGANMTIQMHMADGYPNYDASSFEARAPIASDDAAIEAIWKQEYSLKEFNDPSNFKTYDELKARLEEVLELNSATPGSGVGGSSKPVESNESYRPSKMRTEAKPAPSYDDEDDEDLKQFKALAG